MHSFGKICCHISLKMNYKSYNSLLHTIKCFTLYMSSHIYSHVTILYNEKAMQVLMKIYCISYISFTSLMF